MYKDSTIIEFEFGQSETASHPWIVHLAIIAMISKRHSSAWKTIQTVFVIMEAPKKD
jgi:hypothetical protein